MQKFLRTLTLAALLLLPWAAQAQNAKVSEYDYSVNTTAAYSTIVGTSGATAWTATDQAAGYVDIAMPFAMYFGETQVTAGSNLRVYGNGSATFESVTGLEGSRLAPLNYASGYTTTANSIHYKSSATSLTVEWRKVTANNENSYSFQLKLYSGGDIEFCYGPMTTGGTLNVFTGLMTSSTDVFRARGEGGTLYWNTLERATDSTTRTLSSNYHPTEGTTYTFTQPACVKPTGITATATAWNTIELAWTVSSNGSGYELKYSTDPDFDPNTQGTSKSINNGTTLTYTLTGLTGNTTYYFYVRKNCNGTPSGWNAVKASATTPTGCPTLSAIASSEVTATGATISWTPSVAATSYEIRYNLGADFDPDENEGTLVTSTDTAKTLTGLTGASTYYYYVRANCVSGLATDWYGPYVFNTSCGAIAVDANNFYTQNFEGYNIPMCWSEEVVEGSATWSYSDGYASFPYTDGAKSRLITPVLNFATGAYQVDFYHAECNWNTSQDSLYVYYRTSATGEWVLLEAFGNATDFNNYNPTLSKATILLPNTNSTYQLAFEGQGHDGYGVYLANVVVRTQPTCPAPTGLAATVEGVLTWTAGNNNTSYDIVYGPAGFTSVEEGTLIQNVTGTTYALANLEGSTSYDAYIRAHCSATNEISEGWVGPASFTTPCMPMPITAAEPFVEGFEGTTIPSCWTVEYVNGTHDWVFNSYGDYSTSTGTHSGSHNALFKHTTTGTVTKLVSPVFNFASGNYSLSFWHIQRPWGSDQDQLKVYYRASLSDDWTLLESYTGAITSWTQAEIALVNTSTTYQIAFEATDSYGYGIGLDDISIVKLADCLNPVGLAASDVTATAATLTWTPRGTATQWEVKVGPRGFNPDEEGTSYTVNTTPTLALDYLYMVTEYDAYVRAICDPEGPTEWSNVCEFKTPCANGGNATIGTGTGTTSGVPVANYGSTYCQQIFTASELTEAGVASDISGLSFNWQAIDASFDKYFTIWMANTNLSSFASTSDFVPYSELTQVYGPVFIEHGTGAGEQEYTFTTPFHWDGTSNIVVVTLMNAGATDNNASRRAYTHNSGISNITMYQRKDNSQYTEEQLATITGYSRTTYRTNITFIAPCDSGSCNAPQTVIALSETEYAATLTFTDVNEETNPSYGIVYGPQGFDPATAGTTVSPINASNYTISGLAARTSYDVYVYAICSGTNGRMVKYNFVTPFIPNCKTPVIDGEYGASNIAYNTATLTWRQPGDQPMFWTVRYADADFDPATAAATAYTELTVQGTAGATAQLTGLVAGTTYYVYIKATCSTAPDLDESPWLHMSNANPAYTFTTPACVEPTDVAANDVTNSTAMISWTEAGNATAWTVKYGPAGFDPDMEGTAVACTTDSIELTGLDAYANYEVYVKSNCTATDESGWSSPAAFRTVCPDGGSATIGEGTGTTSGVPVANYGSTYCQQIFTAEELREAGVANNIAGLAFNWQAIDASFDKYFSIWLAQTDMSSFASTSDFVPYSELTPVYGPVFIEHGTGAGEQEYVFNTPFTWDGNSNIVVVTLMNAGATDNNASRRAYTHSTGSSYRSMYQRKDNEQYTEEQLATITGSSRSTYRANITFIAPCNTDVTCFAPASVSTSITTANVVTVNWAARTDLRPVVNNYELKYGMEGFNPETQGVLVSDLNNVNTYTIDVDLAANANYDVYVRTVCDADNDDYSSWTKASFTTYPTCWVPVDLTVTGTTQTTATLSWANDSLAPTDANNWEVCYGPEGFGNPEYYGTKVETTNNTAFTVTGLNHSTKYEFYVRAICNVATNDKSDWSAVATQRTQCGVWTLDDLDGKPLVENFDGVTGTTSSTINNHVLPNCWDYINTSTTTSGTSTTGYPGYPIAYNGASYSHSGNNHMRFYTYTTSAYGDQYAILPQFGFDLDTVVVGFYARESSTTATYVGNIEVGVMSDPEDASTFEVVGSVLPTTTSYEYFEVSFEDYEGSSRYIALRAPKPTSGYNIVYVDDLTVKLREKVNTLPNNGGSIVACNEFIMPDTAANNGEYSDNINATYVVRPGKAGYVARLQGDYDLENGYDFLNVYRGTATAANLIGRYTGTGSIDYMTTSELWADSGYFTLVFTSDIDNALPHTGFKFLVTCEQPLANPTPIEDVVEVNGTYTWTAGNGETYTNHSTMEAAPDRLEDITFPLVNVAGFDSVYRHLTLTVHPTYELNYSHVMCERDTFEFYDTTFTATGNYSVTLKSQYGADSTGILALQVNAAPVAYIQYNNRTVTAVPNMCDNFDMTINARSNVEGVTFLWDDSSTAATRVVNPHESNIYSVVATNPTTGCTSLPAEVTVTTTPVPDLTISGDAEICYNQTTATLTLTDANEVPATYRWSTADTTTAITVAPTAQTTYTVIATSTTGACRDTATFTVDVNPLPNVTAMATPDVLCQNADITLSATEVEGYTYQWNTGDLTREATIAAATSRNFTVTVTDEKGCYKEFTTNNVTVNPVYELNDEQSACVGMLPVTWGTLSLAEAGSYDQTFQTINGCDSIVHLTFIVQDTANNNSYRELCKDATFTFGTGIYEQTYTATESTIISYVDTTSGECPARFNLNLTVNTHNPATVENTVCDSYEWPLTNEILTTSGAYSTMLQTTKGCDSLVTLNLTVNYQNTGIDEQTACDEYTWIDGITYYESNNTATKTLKNQWTCDSVVTLNLTVNYKSYHEDFHCVRDFKDFTWNDNETYSLNVNVEDGIEWVSGKNAYNCDEIAQLHLVLNPVIDTLNWVNVEACDEYEIANAVVFNDENDCEGHIESMFFRDNDDIELRTRTNGNDQWTRIHLTVTPSSYHTTIAEGCLPYTWTVYRPDSTLFEVATITEAMVNGANPFNMSVDLAEAGFVTSGCASIEVLRLTPKYPTTVVTDTVVICDNGSWTAPNNDVYNGANYTSGIYTWDDTEDNAAGCKLTKQVDLTVNPTVKDTVDVTYCESEFVNGILNYIEGNDTLPLTIDVAGLGENVYTDTLTADWATDAGCSRTVTVNYTVNPIITVIDTVQALTEYEWDVNGMLYKGLGEHFDTVTSSNDSICLLRQVLFLTITDSIRVYDTVEVCTNYEVDGKTYVEDMTFVEPGNNDTVYYHTYHIIQRTFHEVYVVSNMPYKWMDSVTYTADTNNVYYSDTISNPNIGECGDVYKLTFTMVPAISICEGQVSDTGYNTGYGYTIVDPQSGVWNNHDANGNDTIIAYTVKLNVATSLYDTACDTYTWVDNVLGDSTFTTSGEYAKTYTAANGCDSTHTLFLTIKNSNGITVPVTYCDSYEWHGVTYTTDTVVTFDTTNAAGCDSTTTLNLTINVNPGVVVDTVACDSFVWFDETFTADTNCTRTFDDENGCAGDSVLHLTVHYTVDTTFDSIVNAAATYYRGILYNAPIDTTINDTVFAGAANGCDSITRMHLQVNMGTIVTVDTISCGDFTWLDGNTYTWIPMSERTNPAFNYKNLATNQPVEDFPVFEVDNNNDGLIDVTYVLHLVMAEASTEYKTVTVLLSNDTYTDPLDTTHHVFDFTAEKAAKQNATKLDTLRYGSTFYCDSIVYYTFNLVYNYVDDDTVTVCYTDSVYTTQNGADIALTVGNNVFTDTVAAGTDSAMIHNMVYVRSAAITGTQDLVACDSVTWNNTLFKANVVDSLVTLTAANGCDSVVTLNITITPTVHNVIEPANVCDTYYWADKDSTYEVSTTDTWSRANATDAQCTDVDTLKLVVKHSTNSIDSLVACDSLVWIDGITYYASNSTATDTLVNAAGCDSVITLNLTINNSFTGAGTDIDTIAASITLTDSLGSYIFIAPCDSNVTFTYKTVAGCDSIVSFHITVNQFQIVADNPIDCGIYTWNVAANPSENILAHGNNHTYRWISDAEKTENAISIPGTSPMLPLYKDVTTNTYVYTNPLDTVDGYVYLLNLNLNEAEFDTSTIARFPQSVNTLTLNGVDFDLTGVTSATKPTCDTVLNLLLDNATLCGTRMTYNVHVVYNYTTDDTTICYTDTYMWEDSITTSTVNVGDNVITDTLYKNSWDSVQVYTRTITVRANNNKDTVVEEKCDTYTWNGQTYTTTGKYSFDTIDQYGCDSVVTLDLTVKYNTNKGETLTACDSTQWNGLKLYATGDTTYSYTADNGCASVDTLHLTIKHNEPQVIVIDTCDSYTWTVGTWSRDYEASGTYNNATGPRLDGDNCKAVDTLILTIRKSTSYDSVLYVTDGSYRYTSPDTTALIMAGQVATFAEHYTNAAGCDSTLNIEIHVGEGYFAAEDVVSCNSYTWRDGNTYVWISAEERAANDNALYKNQTTGAYVKSNPIYSVANAGSYDSIYMLRLNLTQNYIFDTTINFPITLGTLVYGDSTFVLFDGDNDEGREFVTTSVEKEVHFHSTYYCDSIHYLHIELQNNYSPVAADNDDICVTDTSYTWRGHELKTKTSDYDHAHTYYIYDAVGTAEAPVVEYIKLTQHPVVYATERRTACDSYTWVVGNDTVGTYTQPTSNATHTTTNMFGCDSTVTLILNINYNSGKLTETEACDTYTWKANNAAQTVIGTYTNTPTDTLFYNYITDGNGCEAIDTLVLTVNHNTSTAYTVDSCDTYTWKVAEGGNGQTYTVSGTYTYNYQTGAGCQSTNTLNLTIRNNSNQTIDTVVCDAYTWSAAEGGDDLTYTVSGTYTFDYNALSGCPSTNTLNLTVNKNSGHVDEVYACDSVQWHNTWFYADNNIATFPYTDGNKCASIDTLHLTIGHASHVSETVAACDSYTWNNSTYNKSGDYTYTDANVANCDSIVTLHLTIYHSDFNGENYATMTVDGWCGDYTWVVNDSTIGTYTESVETSTSFTSPVTGCDSIVFLNLTIKNAPVIDTTDIVCENTLPYEWRGITMNAAGVETVKFPLDNGCDSTIRFTLNVNPKYDTLLTADVCLGSNYEGNGFKIDATELPEVGEYTFVDSLASEFGCDSIVTLTINVKNIFTTTVYDTACESYKWDYMADPLTESGNYDVTLTAIDNSCDSIVTLALTIKHATTGIDEQTACNRFTWIDGNTYYESNTTATHTLENANGCDSVVTLNLTVNYSNNFEFNDAACDSYTWNNATYSQSGDYTYAGTNVDGCDSVVTLHLTINHNDGSEEIVNGVCDSYLWQYMAEPLTESGDYTVNYNDGNNCPGTHTLHLTVNHNEGTEDTMVVCDSYPWQYMDEPLTESGDYTVPYTDGNNCEGNHILHLTVNASTTGNEEITACDSLEWNGETYYTSDVYTYNTTNVAGCDSTVTLTLTINQSVTDAFNDEGCGSYTWNDQTYTASGDYTQTFKAANECDSIVTLTLTINTNAGTEETVTECDSYLWQYMAEPLTESGDYTVPYTDDNTCEGNHILHLTVNVSTNSTTDVTACDSYTWNNTPYSQSGTYTYQTTNAAGCDSIATLNLTINNSTSSSEIIANCGAYEWNGQTYSQTGLYTYTTTNVAGCDSTATLSLVINQSITSTESAENCDSYTWHGKTYTQSGVYADTTLTDGGCDNIATLLLTIKNSTHNSETVTACNNYIWNNTEYTTSGTKLYNYTNAAGCASVDTLHLTVNTSSTATVPVTACGQYVWEEGTGVTYTTSDNYTYTTTNAAECDSIVTLALTINQPVTNSFNDEGCVSYTWNDQTYYTSGTYTQTFTAANECDSIVTLTLTINQPVTTSFDKTACESFTWNDQTYTASGDYTQTFTASAANGCDSIRTLHLTINNATNGVDVKTACESYEWMDGVTYTASTTSPTYTLTGVNGCDSIVTLNLTIKHATTGSENVTICDSYIWNEETFTQSGDYTRTLEAANECDSIVTLHLTINNSNTGIDEQVACGSFTWIDNVTYTTSTTTPTFTLTNFAGCDSVVTLNLTINQPVTAEDTREACDSMEWNGTTYYTSGDYNFNTSASNSCDSTVTLHLTINHSNTGIDEQVACGSFTWIDGVTYTTSTTAPTFTLTGANVNGCDSVVTLNLTINNATSFSETVTTCVSYTWNGVTYNQSGDYTYTTSGINGCDSVATLHLTINQPVDTTVSVSECVSYSWNGTTYTESGIYRDTLQAQNTCDSIVTLVLSIKSNVVTYTEASACDSYTWNGSEYTVSGNYSYTTTAANGCDSIVNLVLTVNASNAAVDEETNCDSYIWIDGVEYTESTNTPTFTLTNVFGCDSVVTLNLTINRSVERYDTVNILSTQLPYNYEGNILPEAGEYIFNERTVNGCDSTVHLVFNVENVNSIDVVNALENLKAYPNPTHGHLTLTADQVVKVEVMDIVGRKVATFEGTNTFDISNLAEGTYTLRITLPEGVAVRKVIKK